MKEYDIVYSPAIENQLRMIKWQIRQNSELMADVVVERLRTKMRSLKHFPARAALLKNKMNVPQGYDVRYVMESGYYIFYFLEKDFVYVYLVVHQHQDYMRYFEFLKNGEKIPEE